MPIYEYKCKNCGQLFDALRATRDADNTINCTSCNKHNTQRILSTFFSPSGNGERGNGTSQCGSCHSKSCATCR